MKRGFLVGIGSYFALVAIWFPTQPDARAGLLRFEGLALAFEAVPVLVAGLAFYAAVHAPPRRAWWHPVLGWVLGFLVSFAAVLLLSFLLWGWITVAR